MSNSIVTAAIEALAQMGVKAMFSCEHPGPSGTVTVPLTGEQLLQYQDDPVAFIASHYGVSKADYLEWHRSDYTVFCAGFTMGGKRCRGQVAGGYGVGVAKWAALNGSMCHAH